MFRATRTGALALTALLAILLALSASMAQADDEAHFWADGEAVKLDLASETEQTLSSGASVYRCATMTGDASYEEQGPEQTATGISYEKCHTTFLGVPFSMTITPKTGCHFTFTAGTYTRVERVSHGSFHICEMTIDIFNTGSPHGSKRCETHVPEQTVQGVTFHSIAIENVMAITIEFDDALITQTVTDFNTFGCNSHVHDALAYVGSIVARGTSVDENYVDTTVVSSNPTPTEILLAADTTQELSSASGLLKCTELNGAAAFPGESAEVTGEAIEYEGCTTTSLGSTFPATVAMNGCHLAFAEGTLVEEGTKTEGSLGIACPGEAKSITISYYTGSHPGGAKRCEIHIPEQTFEGVATYHNTTIEGVMVVTVTADSLKVTETVTDFNTIGCNEHVHDTATYSGSLWWGAEDHDGSYIDVTASGGP